MSASQKVLLFTSKLGYQARSFADAAQRLHVDLQYVTDRCHQLADPWGDQALPVHFETPEAAAYDVMEAFRTSNVSAILSLGDRPSLTAAYAARGLAIPYNHPAAVEACRSKLRLREVFQQAGLPTPWFRSLPLTPAPEPSLLGISYPCVLKPLSLSASQGVIRADNREQFVAAASRIRRLLQSPEIRATREPNLDSMLVEGYLPGKEVAVEAIIANGLLRILAIFDKPDPLEGPFFEETIYTAPSRLPEDQQQSIIRCCQQAVRAVGISHGPVHAEFRIDNGQVWPLEIAPRPIGGLCSKSLRFRTPESGESISLEELLLRNALELPGADSPREAEASGVMMIPVPHSGLLQSVHGEAAARAIPGISEVTITARLHDYVAAWPEGSSYLGFIFARRETPAALELALREAHSKLHFTLTPTIPVEHPAAHSSQEPA